ncbi:NAD-specific glutamate dehydrogenase [Cutibacterium acnes JCM 18918]|nr:NAD-specific glutamate dehydrogenase [Cutibacterium acnes JCM 18918]
MVVHAKALTLVEFSMRTTWRWPRDHDEGDLIVSEMDEVIPALVAAVQEQHAPEIITVTMRFVKRWNTRRSSHCDLGRFALTSSSIRRGQTADKFCSGRDG